jgi:hypothetical protein
MGGQARAFPAFLKLKRQAANIARHDSRPKGERDAGASTDRTGAIATLIGGTQDDARR